MSVDWHDKQEFDLSRMRELERQNADLQSANVRFEQRARAAEAALRKIWITKEHDGAYTLWLEETPPGPLRRTRVFPLGKDFGTHSAHLDAWREQRREVLKEVGL